MKIVHYAYDHIENPWCGGGGAKRDRAIYAYAPATHEVTMYYGNFPGARTHMVGPCTFVPRGLCWSYLVSRITFAVWANMHCLFSSHELRVVSFSAYAPVLTPLVRKKSILGIYHIMGRHAIKERGWFLGTLARMAEAIVVRSSVPAFTISSGVRDRIARTKPPQSPLEIIYTGIDDGLLCKHDGPVEDDGAILFIGRINIVMKGIDLLVKAYSSVADQLPGSKVVIAGKMDDERYAKLRMLLQESRVRDRFVVEANISNDRKKELLQTCRMVCLPSRFEGWCIAAIEAGACKKAVLGTNIDGLSQAVVNGQTGILVQSENLGALSKEMVHLYNDARLRLQLGHNGWLHAQEFSLQKISDKQFALYVSVLHSR